MSKETRSKINDTLKDRGALYGDFTDHAIIAQNVKALMQQTEGWTRLSTDKRQALEVIADKIARILNGDPEHQDNWHDIAGYAILAEQRCKLL